MSEYQYYEFQSIDNQLDNNTRQAMEQLSSRVVLTATSASFVYHYGDFRGNEKDILAEYFDMMLYITNWGVRQLMFRLPTPLIDVGRLQPYLFEEEISLQTIGNYLILDISYNDEVGGGWVEGEGWLPHLLPIRDELLQNDFRILYLAWLKIASGRYMYDLESDEDLPEPPIPHGLNQLTSAHQTFINFFEIDRDLIAAAAQLSKPKEQQSVDYQQYLTHLSAEEMRTYLARLLSGEKYLGTSLMKHLQKYTTESTLMVHTPSSRGIGMLMDEAKLMEQTRIAEEKRQAEIKLRNHLKNIAPKEQQLWQQVLELIAEKSTRTYDEAVAILRDLRALAEAEMRLDEFKEKLAGIRDQHPTLRALHRRLYEAGLFD